MIFKKGALARAGYQRNPMPTFGIKGDVLIILDEDYDGLHMRVYNQTQQREHLINRERVMPMTRDKQ